MGALIDTFQYFTSLNKIEYQFDVSINRKLRTLIIDFDEADFYHIGGFQHLDDIALDKHTKVFNQKIKNGLITDEYLSKSIYYSPISYEEKSGIKDRIDEINKQAAQNACRFLDPERQEPFRFFTGEQKRDRTICRADS